MICPKTFKNCECTGCSDTIKICEQSGIIIDKPIENVFPNYGWLCTKCGRGNSPYTTTCPCTPLPFEVTYKQTQ